MSIALYRRYRPDTFEEVIGQDHVIEPIMAALEAGRTTHAYLFSGPRGCGKTTSARILARCLNCAQYPTPTPCGECPSCRELARDGSGSLDVVELDAASHGGVDDARDLREQASFAPVRDRFKIFIIDEAHMVTTQGFNALLKLVEEPPAHVKFIFATTEPEKVIGTIRSRTHHYPFRLVPPPVLEEYLLEICRDEGINAPREVLSLVVRAGTGSVRDTLSVLDQIIGGSDGTTLEYQRAIALLGYTSVHLLDQTIQAITQNDGAKLFQVVDTIITSGHDPRRFVEDLLQRLRDLVILALAGETSREVFVQVPADQFAAMLEQAALIGAKRASLCADFANEALSTMAGATAPRLQLELLCARLLVQSNPESAGTLSNTALQTAAMPQSKTIPASSSTPTASGTTSNSAPHPVPAKSGSAQSTPQNSMRQNFSAGADLGRSTGSMASGTAAGGSRSSGENSANQNPQSAAARSALNPLAAPMPSIGNPLNTPPAANPPAPLHDPDSAPMPMPAAVPHPPALSASAISESGVPNSAALASGVPNSAAPAVNMPNSVTPAVNTLGSGAPTSGISSSNAPAPKTAQVSQSSQAAPVPETVPAPQSSQAMPRALAAQTSPKTLQNTNPASANASNYYAPEYAQIVSQWSEILQLTMNKSSAVAEIMTHSKGLAAIEQNILSIFFETEKWAALFDQTIPALDIVARAVYAKTGLKLRVRGVVAKTDALNNLVASSLAVNETHAGQKQDTPIDTASQNLPTTQNVIQNTPVQAGDGEYPKAPYENAEQQIPSLNTQIKTADELTDTCLPDPPAPEPDFAISAPELPEQSSQTEASQNTDPLGVLRQLLAGFVQVSAENSFPKTAENTGRLAENIPDSVPNMSHTAAENSIDTTNTNAGLNLAGTQNTAASSIASAQISTFEMRSSEKIHTPEQTSEQRLEKTPEKTLEQTPEKTSEHVPEQIHTLESEIPVNSEYSPAKYNSPDSASHSQSRDEIPFYRQKLPNIPPAVFPQAQATQPAQPKQSVQANQSLLSTQAKQSTHSNKTAPENHTDNTNKPNIADSTATEKRSNLLHAPIASLNPHTSEQPNFSTDAFTQLRNKNLNTELAAKNTSTPSLSERIAAHVDTSVETRNNPFAQPENSPAAQETENSGNEWDEVSTDDPSISETAFAGVNIVLEELGGKIIAEIPKETKK